jgi:hypothetical protein
MGFLRVEVYIGLLRVPVKSMSRGEIHTRPSTGKQGAVAVVAAEEYMKNTNFE